MARRTTIEALSYVKAMWLTKDDNWGIIICEGSVANEELILRVLGSSGAFTPWHIGCCNLLPALWRRSGCCTLLPALWRTHRLLQSTPYTVAAQRQMHSTPCTVADASAAALYSLHCGGRIGCYTLLPALWRTHRLRPSHLPARQTNKIQYKIRNSTEKLIYRYCFTKWD